MSTEPSTSYLRRLGIWDAAAIVMGGVIGAGIFRTPATVAQRTGSSTELLVLWAIGGLLTLTGVLCYAELGARRPQAGGTYVYLREAFGKLPAFLFGWTMALINYPGSVAAVAVTFADYFCAALGLPVGLVKPVAVGAIGFIVGINFFGIRAGALMQNIFTVLKLGALMLLVVVGLFFARGEVGPTLAIDAVQPASPWAFVGALLPVLFSYGGFHYLNDMAGEVRNPQRTLPRALGLGMTGVLVSYLLVNLAYLNGLGHAGLAASRAPAADLMRQLLGESGATVIAVGIACSTFGYCAIAIAGGRARAADDGCRRHVFQRGRPDRAAPPGAAGGAGDAGRVGYRADPFGQLWPIAGLHHGGRMAGARVRHCHVVLVPPLSAGRAVAVQGAAVSADAADLRVHGAGGDYRQRHPRAGRCRDEPADHRAGGARVLRLALAGAAVEGLTSNPPLTPGWSPHQSRSR